MDSVIMTSPENGTRLRSRMRSAVNVVCARSSKRASNRNVNGNHHKNGRNGTLSRNNSIHRSNSIHKHVNNCNVNRNNVNSTVTYVNGQDIVNKNINNEHSCHQNGLKMPNGFINGRNAREVYSAWCGRLGPAPHIPAESVQALFNDMRLYPSKAQVHEMLQCVRMYGNTSRTGLTFGEFCVFANELRHLKQGSNAPITKARHASRLQQGYSTHSLLSNRTNSNIKVPTYEVFLGGSCNPTTWRKDTAIPMLEQYGISYYNPQVSTWSPDLLAAEHEAKEIANVLLFVLDSETRCIAGMVEVSQLSAAQRCLVVVALAYKPHQQITNETISNQEYLDLWYGQSTLLALIRQGKTPVFTHLIPALKCTATLLRPPTSENDCISELQLAEKLTKLREAFDSADVNQMGSLTLREVSDAYYNVTGMSLRLSELKAIVQNDDSTNLDNVRITFERFCGIVAEFSMNGGCDSLTEDRIDGWSSNQPLQRQCSANNNTNNCGSTDNHITCSMKNGAITTDYSKSFNKSFEDDSRDIYLGGSCLRRTSWRDDIAVPMLKKHNLTYYFPQVHEKDISTISSRNNSVQNITRTMSSSSEEDMDYMSVDDDADDVFVENVKNSFDVDMEVANDIRKMENSRVLLFVITNETRSIAPMLLAAHCIGKQKKNVVLCVQQLNTESCVIGDEQLSKYAIKDYNRSRAYLSDMAKREGYPVYESVEDAVQCAINMSLERR